MIVHCSSKISDHNDLLISNIGPELQKIVFYHLNKQLFFYNLTFAFVVIFQKLKKHYDHSDYTEMSNVTNIQKKKLFGNLILQK